MKPQAGIFGISVVFYAHLHGSGEIWYYIVQKSSDHVVTLWPAGCIQGEDTLKGKEMKND